MAFPVHPKVTEKAANKLRFDLQSPFKGAIGECHVCIMFLPQYVTLMSEHGDLIFSVSL